MASALLRATTKHVVGDRSGLCGSASVADFRGFVQDLAIKLNALERAINHRFQFVSVLYFAAFDQLPPGVFRTEPGGMPHRFVSPAKLLNFHQEGLDHILLHATGLPEHSLGMNVEMKVPRLDRAQRSGLFGGLAFGGLTVRETG